MTNKRFNLFALLLMLAFFSCNDNIIATKDIDIESGVWDINDTIKINAEITDVNSFYNIYIKIENKESFLTNNLWLFIHSKSPSGNTQIDTTLFYLTNEKGEWFGDKKGELIKNKFLYKPKIKFPETGTYHFILLHGMRKNDLPEVVEVGIIVEKIAD